MNLGLCERVPRWWFLLSSYSDVGPMPSPWIDLGLPPDQGSIRHNILMIHRVDVGQSRPFSLGFVGDRGQPTKSNTKYFVLS